MFSQHTNHEQKFGHEVAESYGLLFRVPVFEQRVDNIVGIAYAMDLLDYVQKVRQFLFCFLLFWPMGDLIINFLQHSHRMQIYNLFNFEG